jgi:hypothetical protein
VHFGVDPRGIKRAVPKVAANFSQRETLGKEMGGACVTQTVRTYAW